MANQPFHVPKGVCESNPSMHSSHAFPGQHIYKPKTHRAQTLSRSDRADSKERVPVRIKQCMLYLTRSQEVFRFRRIVGFLPMLLKCISGLCGLGETLHQASTLVLCTVICILLVSLCKQTQKKKHPDTALILED